jgi:wobble nucleotide-excising tRNase
MKLQKINKINTASFSNFTWDNEVSNFSDVNIVLGWNGTGKTIISRILRSFEFNNILELPENCQFLLEFDQNNRDQSQLEGFRDKVRVFNEDYIKHITGVSNLPHIFYLGEDAVDFSEKQKEVDDLQSQIKACTNEHSAIAEKVARNIKSLAGIARLNKELQSGVYNTFDKRGFENRFENIQHKIVQEGALIEDFLMDEENFKIAQRQLAQQADKKREFNILKEVDGWLVTNTTEIKNILSKQSKFDPSSRIENYSKDSQEYGWIRKGVEIHKLNDSNHKLDSCIFCSNQIQNAEELIKHFTNDIIELNRSLDVCLLKISGYQERLSLNEYNFYSNEAKRLADFLNEVFTKLENKKNDPTLQINTDDFSSVFQQEQEENDNFDEIAHKLEQHFVADVFDDYKAKNDNYMTCCLEQETISSSLQTAKTQLLELKAQAKNAHRPAEKLNKLIKVTFPFKNIEIKDSEDGIGYSLYRNNNECSFHTLSEGERNFIALAYFLISLNTVEEENSLIKEGIVIIDDPISSLDKNSIFQIFSIISYEMENYKLRQYFILTHNLEFFSHLHDHYRSKIEDGKVQLYQVNLSKNGSKICNLHKLLRNFKSDYQYSAKTLWEHRNDCDIEDAFLMVNLLRRVWETFLHFKFSSNGDFKSMLEKAYTEAVNEKIKNLPDNVPQERKDEIKEEYRSNYIAMYRFTNYGSHEFGGVDTIDESILLNATDRIKNFFDIVEIIDNYHFKKITT